MTISIPGFRAVNFCATQFVCHNASWLARVPMTILVTVLVSLYAGAQGRILSAVDGSPLLLCSSVPLQGLRLLKNRFHRAPCVLIAPLTQ